MFFGDLSGHPALAQLLAQQQQAQAQAQAQAQGMAFPGYAAVNGQLVPFPQHPFFLPSQPAPTGSRTRRRNKKQPAQAHTPAQAQLNPKAQDSDDDDDAPAELVQHYMPDLALRPLPHDLQEDRGDRRAQRSHQVALGKDTGGYRLYTATVPKHLRQLDNPNHPITPRTGIRAPRRQWKKACSAWRQQLHLWDADPDAAAMIDPTLSTLGQLGLEPVPGGVVGGGQAPPSAVPAMDLPQLTMFEVKGDKTPDTTTPTDDTPVPAPASRP